MIEACNLLSLNDLKDLGIKVGSRPDPNVVNFERTYLVGDGKGPLETSFGTYSKADGLAVDKCAYALEPKDGTLQESLAVAVSQPAYVSGTAETAAAFVGAPASITLGQVQGDGSAGKLQDIAKRVMQTSRSRRTRRPGRAPSATRARSSRNRSRSRARCSRPTW
ncbi:hypothetical protein [Amycolatopsis sp. NPDC051372]|uniref:hypothetical protein n=1 Tax=Amycolatopsis sp. NPDC051372 TaxID=3155669 RepID=UPI003415F1A7